MKRNMWIWGAVFVTGIVIIVLYPVLIPVGAETGTRFGAGVMVPVGYIVALIGAASMFVAWMRGRKR